jgi:hypothetical protein
VALNTATIKSTSNASSTNTGALTVSGGAGIGRNLYVGENVTITGTVVGGGIRTTTTATAPSNPTVGDVWYDTVTDTINRYTYDSSSTFWLDITGPAVGNASTVGFTATTITGNIIPNADAVYTLGDPTHRFASAYVGTGSFYIQDVSLLTNAELTVDNGIFYVNGVGGLVAGGLLISNNILTTTATNINLNVGSPALTDTGTISLNRNVTVATGKTLNVGGTLTVNTLTINTLSTNPIFPVSYGQFITTSTQSLSTASYISAIVPTTSTAVVNASYSGSKIYITKPYMYSVSYVIGVNQSGGGGANRSAYFWLRYNGIDVPNSLNSVSLSSNLTMLVTAAINVTTTATTDYIQLLWAVDNTSVTLPGTPAQTTPFAAPASPSVILTITPIIH